MALWWNYIYLVYFFSVGFAQKNCGRRVNFPAPGFGVGDNLSSERCGLWDTQENERAPWYVYVRNPNSGGCWCTLISPASALSVACNTEADEFVISEEKEYWVADLGKCASSHDYVKCLENGEGQIVKVKNVTKLRARGYPHSLHIWKFERSTWKSNYIVPICIYNKGNGRDFARTQQYTAFNWKRYYQLSAKLSEDFDPCLNQSTDFKTCDKVHERFLCARLPKDGWFDPYYLTHEENDRFFLRALRVEYIVSNDVFFYEIVPLLGQIIGANDDISMMSTIPPVKKRTVFKGGESFPGCGSVSNYRRRREDTTEATNFILRGKNAAKKEHPWHAAIVDLNDHVLCGGSLISRRAVLTAAHCFIFPGNEYRSTSEFFVVFGVSENEKIHEKGAVIGRQIATPSNVIVHPEFSHHTKGNNLAIVLLQGSGVAITSYVRPICLWKNDYDFEIINNKTGKVAGWGYTEDGQLPNQLQVVELRLVPYQECYLTNSHFFNIYLMPGLNFCAGGKGLGTCMGDSGEGFSIAEEGKWYLRGVVSFGHTERINIDGHTINVCKGTYPSIFTDITYYMDWIVQTAGLSDRIQN